MSGSAHWPLTIGLPDEAATLKLAAALAQAVRPGDTIALSGGLGSGKTTLARALIRSLAGNPALEVPSPTFTLMQAYPEARIEVRHFDLYRLTAASELDELGFVETGETLTVVEWPERASGRLPPDALRVELAFAGPGRVASLSGPAGWSSRLGTWLRRATLHAKRP